MKKESMLVRENKGGRKSYNVTIYYSASVTVNVEAEDVESAHAEGQALAAIEEFGYVEEEGYRILELDAEGNVVNEWTEDEDPYDGEGEEE